MKSKNLADKLFTVFIYILVTLFTMACIFPFFYVAAYSVMPYSEYLQNPVKLIPSRIEFAAYRQIIKMPAIWSGYRVTILITVFGVILNIILMVLTAYPLSKKDLKGRNVILVLITFTMFFNGGMIPNFYLVKKLGLYNSILSMIIPGALSAFNLILMKNFMSSIPESIEESAIIDGANEITILFRIIIPLSMPAIATFIIFHAVKQWNTFFSAIIYTSKRSLWPLMLILRDMVVEDGQVDIMDDGTTVQAFTIKMAAIIFTTLPMNVSY